MMIAQELQSNEVTKKCCAYRNKSLTTLKIGSDVYRSCVLCYYDHVPDPLNINIFFLNYSKL